MTQFIDRRRNGKSKSTINRQRFIRRFKQQIKAAVADFISQRSITNIEQGEKILIPKKDISEPLFSHGKGGKREVILPGNKNFILGDKIQRPSNAESQSHNASNQGEGVDDFIFELSKDEFLDLFFEDLALPDLIKTKLTHEPTFVQTKAGFTTVGTPPNIHLIKSFKNAISRRLIFKGAYQKKEKQLKDELKFLLSEKNPNIKKIEAIQEKLKKLLKKQMKIPFIDTNDIRYINKIKQQKPTTQAVMFCLMDVSGSMDESKKDLAKRFFILLYLFLTKNYQKISLVFIRHHTTAKEVDEKEFFYSRETGGTVVSSALELMHKIIVERFPTEDWNIYVAQASDGDNWNADSPKCQEILENFIMQYVQYYAYIEILPRHHQSLWRAYIAIREKFKHFAMRDINDKKDLYPVFRDLFKKKSHA